MKVVEKVIGEQFPRVEGVTSGSCLIVREEFYVLVVVLSTRICRGDSFTELDTQINIHKKNAL